jgi:hypothetical protein
MQGHQYVALRRLTCEDGSEQLIVHPGDTIPTRVSDKWPPPAIRAMVNCGHIQFAQIRDTKTLPYLEQPAQATSKAVQRAVVDHPEQAPHTRAPAKALAKVATKRSTKASARA